MTVTNYGASLNDINHGEIPGSTYLYYVHIDNQDGSNVQDCIHGQSHT